jgi:hypothetical protein
MVCGLQGASELIACKRLQWQSMYQDYQITVRLVEIFKLRLLALQPCLPLTHPRGEEELDE